MWRHKNVRFIASKAGVRYASGSVRRFNDRRYEIQLNYYNYSYSFDYNYNYYLQLMLLLLL